MPDHRAESARSRDLGSPPVSQTGPKGPRLLYLPGLDGLRALAVVAVLLYHAEVPWMPGGYLGVEIFFVLSGYLITSLLLTEWRQSGRIDLPAFWLRRARRLLPALFLLLGVTLSFAVLFHPEEVAGVRGDAAAATGYVTNWYLIFSQQSYFEAVGRPGMLQHLWSLAVEEQFYLVWPVLFLLGLRVARLRRFFPLIILAGAAGSALLMAALFRPDVDPSRVYYGTDTRAAGLLLGCALAFARPRVPATAALERRWRWALDATGVLAVGALVLILVTLDETQSFLYQGGFAVTAIATAAAIAASVHPSARLLPLVLGGRAVRWIGMRSYGIYLWHWPVFVFTRPELDVALEGVPLLALRFGLTLLLAGLSYRFVEVPIRTGALARAWRSWRNAQGAQRQRAGARWAAATLAGGLFALALSVSLVQAKPPAIPDYLAIPDTSVEATVEAAQVAAPKPAAPLPDADAEPASVALPSAAAVAPAEDPALAHPTPAGLSSAEVSTPVPATPVPTAVPTMGAVAAAGGLPLYSVSHSDPAGSPLLTATPLRTATGTPARTATPAATRTPIGLEVVVTRVAEAAATVAAGGTYTGAAGASPTRTPVVQRTPTSTPAAQRTPTAISGHVVALGDSVMLGAAAEMRRQIRGIEVDAAQNRQASAVVQMLQSRAASGKLGDVLAIHIGNNGYFTAAQFDQMMRAIGTTRPVVFINNKVPRRWEAPNNAVISAGVSRYPNARLLDWHGASSGRSDLFWTDGIHLRPAGAQFYTQLLIAALSR